MIRIGIDAMGGDNAPDLIIEGALHALTELENGSRIVLFGDRVVIDNVLASKKVAGDMFDIVHTSEVITMQDHAAKAWNRKPDSSIRVGFDYLKNNKIDGFASAGSTGAMLVGAVYCAEPIRNVIRPGISALVSTTDGGSVLLLDVGLNVDCKPDVLEQYGILGSAYMQAVMNKEKPRVALLNIGEEREKGNLATKAAYELMEENAFINFVGNIEANDIFTGRIADVVVCDGFVGNTILKQTEGFYEIARERGIRDSYIDKLNYEYVGGTVILGINAVVLIGHGRSSALAVKNMILQTEKTVKSGLVDKLKDTFRNF